MVTAVTARWHGDDYQSRFFWIKAAALRDPDTPHVIEVSYEADGPKAFDDVIIRYSPSRASCGPERISADYFQIKFHVVRAGRFGYEDLVLPEFIGAQTTSLLERLQEAKLSSSGNAAFHLVTTDSIKDGDPLGELISSENGRLRTDKLSEGKTDSSKMGRVRKLWRTHLGLKDNDELFEILKNFHVHANQPSLERLRDDVNIKFQIIGLTPCTSSSEFRYDGAAKALKSRGLYQFTREAFEALCLQEGWVKSEPSGEFINVALRSFSDGPADFMDATPENTLSLLHFFHGRHLSPDEDWDTNVRPLVEDFFQRIRQHERRIRLFLDTHSSVAFLAGKCLGLKSGMAVELIQKGRAGTSVWRSDDQSEIKPTVTSIEHINEGVDIAVVMSITRDASDHVREYLASCQPEVGRMLHVTPDGGPGQNAITGGAHAARLAENIADAVAKARVKFGARVHIFSAAPGAVNFFTGQQLESMGRCVLYEFDFNQRIDGSYHPSFKV